MKFCEEFNKYMKILECTPKDFSEASTLSPTLISRYLNNKRTPRVDSEYFTKIVDGIMKISEEKKLGLKIEEVSEHLTKSITYTDINYDDFVVNFNTLLSELKISTSEIAKAIGYDTSFISKIKNKTRKPSDVDKFIDEIGNYLVDNFSDEEGKKNVSTLFGCSTSKLNEEESYKSHLVKWITSTQEDHKDLVNRFLSSLDTFNLNDYIGMDFSKVKVPTSPIILKTTKIYYGPEGRKEAEAEFLKNTLLSKSKEPIYFYSDLPMADAGNDETFKKNWIKVITLILKKGLHLNIIHNIDRPISEMLMGIENWIPVYMTGSISPYYFKNPPSNIFTGSYMSSGACILSGECFQDNLEKSRYYFTNKKEEIDYYNEKGKYLISKAKPLMSIYKEENKDEFKEFLKSKENENTEHITKDIFKNIDFTLSKGKWVMINKLSSPEIHFVIHNSKLLSAIEDFLDD
ncbi:MAG: hypothetical protein J6M60_04605 [Clostridia bacterium]|nr:hypothetical protein [Clostridia bacterium]